MHRGHIGVQLIGRDPGEGLLDCFLSTLQDLNEEGLLGRHVMDVQQHAGDPDLTVAGPADPQQRFHFALVQIDHSPADVHELKHENLV